MDLSLYDDVSSLVKSKGHCWEPTCITVISSLVSFNLMDYISGGRPDLTSLTFEKGSKDIRVPIINLFKNACAEAGFELICKGWNEARKRLDFGCQRGDSFKRSTKTIGSNGKKIDSKTTKPLEKDETCPFSFAVHWVQDELSSIDDVGSWVMKSGNGCRIHQGHEKKESFEVRKRITDLPKEELQLIIDCLSVGMGTGPAGALTTRRTGLLLSRGQLYRLGLSSRKNQQTILKNPSMISNLSSPAARLVHYLETEPNLSYVLLFDHPDSKLVTVRKPSRSEIVNSQRVGTGTIEECVLPEVHQQAFREYRKVIRNALIVESKDEVENEEIISQKILVGAAWNSDNESRMSICHPEIFGVDITEKTNKEKRPLIILAGLTGDNKTYTAARALLPSGQRWVHYWFTQTVLPILIPKKARERNRVMFTDGDELEYSAFTSAIPDHFPNSCHHLCSWHLFHRNLKQSNGYPSGKHIIGKSKAYVDVIEAWIKSWFRHVESTEEYQISKKLFFRYLSQPPPGVTEANTLHIRDWIINSLDPLQEKWMFAYFLNRQTFNRESTQFVEAENSVLKSTKLGTRPNQSIDTSALTQNNLSEQRLDKDRKAIATKVDQTRVSENALQFPEINGVINNVGFKLVIGQYFGAKNLEVYRQSESVFLVQQKTTLLENVPSYEQTTKFINYMVPTFERTRVVEIISNAGRMHMVCSCGYFKRMGIPCRHMYCILKRKPLPSDLILRYHLQFHHKYQMPGCEEISNAFDQILSDPVQGPVLKEKIAFEEFQIASSIPDTVLETLPHKDPVLSMNCFWKNQQKSDESMIEIENGDDFPCAELYNANVELSQAIGLSQHAEGRSKSCDNDENIDSSLNFLGRKRLIDAYGETNPIYQMLLKEAESDEENLSIMKEGLNALLEKCLKNTAKKKKVKIISQSNVISACLETETQRKYSRKKPLKERYSGK
jgi:MULE transposase domain